MELAARYEFFARVYGWTKQQVDDQPDWLIERLPSVHSVLGEIAEDRRAAAAAQAAAERELMAARPGRT